MQTKNIKSKILNTLKKLYTPWNLFILIILLLAFILRIYRIEELLDFHYDQGRDAMVIWKLWHGHKLFLIGPVTGLEGIFLGPFYYYLIAPFYLIGKGNPTIPSMFLSLLVTLSLFVLYKAGELIANKKLGIIALVIGSFSYSLILSSRWLSNPTPIYLTSILIFYLMIKIIKSPKSFYWYLIYLLAGVSMHFESASAIIYMPIVLFFTIWQKKKLNIKTFLISSCLLFLTFTPQLLFNFKHDNILVNNIFKELPKQEENTSRITRLLSDRFKLFWEMFSVKIFADNNKLSVGFGLLSLSGLILIIKNKKYKDIFNLFVIFLGIPLIFYTIYRGNYGVLYDYYFTGYYLILVLLFSFGLWSMSNLKFGKYLLALFFILFLFSNLKLIQKKLTIGVNDGNDIFISNQLQSIMWIYQNAKDTEFNVDVYVPPVIPHSYDYLFTYVGDKRALSNVKTLYTLYEADPPHPDRIGAWLKRQEGIGKVEETVKFGGITVERRMRFN